MGLGYICYMVDEFGGEVLEGKGGVGVNAGSMVRASGMWVH